MQGNLGSCLQLVQMLNGLSWSSTKVSFEFVHHLQRWSQFFSPLDTFVWGHLSCSNHLTVPSLQTLMVVNNLMFFMNFQATFLYCKYIHSQQLLIQISLCLSESLRLWPLPHQLLITVLVCVNTLLGLLRERMSFHASTSLVNRLTLSLQHSDLVS